MQTEPGSVKLNLEGRGFKHILSWKAYSWLADCFCKPKQADLTGPMLAPGSKPGIGISRGATPLGESAAITGRCRGVNISLEDERLPSELG